MPHGYAGKILKVDLSTGQISVDEHDEVWYRTYMGGAAVGAYYLLNEMPPKADPYGPDNLLVFATSVVVGAPMSGYNRYSITGKSPLTGLIGDTQSSGFWGPELKFAGFDALVIRGVSAKPVYLWIHDGQAEIRDASSIWGLETKESQEKIRQELGDKMIRVAQIGPGGEKLVRFANVTNDLNHFNGRTGMGCVMGAKKLKAIAVRGHHKVELANPEKVNQLARYYSQTFKQNPSCRGNNLLGTSEYVGVQNVDGQLPTRNFQTGVLEGGEAIYGETMHEEMEVTNESCWGCATRCKRVVRAEKPYFVDPAYGGPEYEAISALGSDCGITDLPAVVKANELCNRYTLDCISTGASIAFAMECYENGLLTKDDTDGMELRFGNGPAVVQMVEKIARREGLGDLLAEGVMRAAQKIGKGADRFAVHARGQELAMHDGRVKGMLGISYAVSPIGADHVVVEHDTDFDFKAPQVFLDQLTPLGVLERLETSSIDNKKLRMFYYLQQHFSFMDTMCLCLFNFGPVRHFKMHELVEGAQAVTGWELSFHEIMKYGERRVNMFRAFNIREESELDRFWLPQRMFEPIQTGPREGYRVDEGALRQALRNYFEIMNWDEKAFPRPMKLAELDLEWINPILEPYRTTAKEAVLE
ncbi:MAG: aldehyde ferredoxin oxidoreductase family protein [Chloroflexi bacterium]|nr:aldehyde ferredoxin oxidoreductase family protein [Chloroflexota bacterium]